MPCTAPGRQQASAPQKARGARSRRPRQRTNSAHYFESRTSTFALRGRSR
jgi:hypothetical protein